MVLRISRPLGKYNRVEALKTNWPTSLSALSLTCRQVYSETLALLYNATVFVCAAPSRLTNFLSAAKLEFITTLELHYETYGDPLVGKDCIWQDRHHNSWDRACAAASKKLVSTFRQINMTVFVFFGGGGSISGGYIPLQRLWGSCLTLFYDETRLANNYSR